VGRALSRKPESGPPSRAHVLSAPGRIGSFERRFRCRAHNVYEAELIFGSYDPSRVRETPAAYGHSGAHWSRDQ